ncbi:MAG TPA: type II secretion system F family protein [Myxococcota bacterium]|nr:type II secretion system F family protein [Myxococcota bacterium]
MAVFEYKGFDGAGGPVAGVIDADSAKVARTRLRRQGVFPTEVKEQTGQGTRGSGLNREIDLAQYLEFITARDISNMTQQMAVLVNASVPLGETLSALVDQTEKNKLRVVLSKIRERVNEGSTLADAMADHPKVFDHLYISMVRAGERTGALGTVLNRLARFNEDAVKLQGQIVSALAYPVLMAIVGSALIMVIFVGVLPQMRGMFESFSKGKGESALPLITRVVFAVGDMVVGWGWLIPIVVTLAVVGFRRWVATAEGREQFDKLKLNIPLFGKMNRMVAVSRFCRTLGTLLLSGVPIVSALGIVREVVGNVVIAHAIQAASVSIQEGQSIARPLKESEQFPPMVIHMIQVGEKTGELEQMLNLIADAYEGEVENTVKGVMSLLGPLTIMMMGGVIFVVALAVLLPMQQLTQMIR